MWHFQNYEDAPILLRQLITNITNLHEGNQRFQRLEEHVIHELKAADSMVFVSKKDLDAIMSSMCDKFIFHGFCMQADELRDAYERFIPSNLSKEDVDGKIITLRLLLSLSESPTKSFSLLPLDCTHTVEEEVIDWPMYLNEGIERWSPPPDETSESWSDDSKSCESSADDCDEEEPARRASAENQEKSLQPKDVLQEYINVCETLSGHVQNSWFTQERIYMVPPSRRADANIAVLWDNFLQRFTKGLIKLSRPKMITEYKVMREILWQLWEPHTSFVFEIVINDLLPRTNIAVSSIRAEPLEKFLYEFLPYIRLLQDLRDFHASLTPSQAHEAIPETYRSYDVAVCNLIKPVYDELLRLEGEVMEQISFMSLLQLADQLRKLFRNAQVIKAIHEQVVSDVETNSPVRCATTLLARLHTGLLHCVNKNEQDIYLSLYLESLYKYFAIIHSWLSQDVLIDISKEFIIADENSKDVHMMLTCDSSCVNQSENPSTTDSTSESDHSDWQMNFVIRNLDETAKADGLLKIIYTEVLQIGKNIHLLRLLKKLHLLKDSANTTTLHEELIARVLREMTEYFGKVGKDSNCELEPEVVSGVLFKFPAICPDDCKYPTEMDRLENLVDTTDGFLMNAFISYFTEEEKTPTLNDQSLYERISGITNNVFPAKQIVDSVFLQILHERYSESGYMVKNLLVDEYHIEKHLQLLQHVYLFKDDIIFLLYRRVFQQMELDSWDSEAWLTNQLQDTLVNIYPDFCENCLVKVKESPFLHYDPLQVCSQVTIEYKIDWPTNIIIRNKHVEMYTELYHVIMQIKWGLYTLNHLYFSEIESKKRPQDQRKVTRDLITKLKVLRFCLLNEFSSIQHYVLGFVYSKCTRKFREDFEKAYSLDTLITAHDDFINDMHSTIMDFKGLNGSTYGLDLFLHLVRKLSSMWVDLKGIDYEDLKKCELMYRRCHEHLDSIMHPKDICFDYN